MNKRDALRAVADDLLGKLLELQTQTEAYGSQHAERDTRDHDRILEAYGEIGYRLSRIVHPSTRRKQVAGPPDPNQVPLFECDETRGGDHVGEEEPVPGLRS